MFKIMSKLTEAEKKVKRDGDGGNEDESGLSKRIASFLNDVSVHSTNPTFRPYASRLLHDVYSGTSLRRGAVAQARAMGLQLDDIASATGHSITLPGGFNSGTVRSGPPTLRELVSHRTFCAFVHTFCPIPHAWAWRAYYLLRGRRVQHPNPNQNYADAVSGITTVDWPLRGSGPCSGSWTRNSAAGKRRVGRRRAASCDWALRACSLFTFTLEVGIQKVEDLRIYELRLLSRAHTKVGQGGGLHRRARRVDSHGRGHTKDRG